jgi:hypothetical protein
VAPKSTFDPLEPISVALIDIQAGYEAQLRLLTAAQVSIQYHREQPTPSKALESCVAYLDRMERTHDVIHAALVETAAVVRATLGARNPQHAGASAITGPRHPAANVDRRTGRDRRHRRNNGH